MHQAADSPCYTLNALKLLQSTLEFSSISLLLTGIILAPSYTNTRTRLMTGLHRQPFIRCDVNKNVALELEDL